MIKPIQNLNTSSLKTLTSVLALLGGFMREADSRHMSNLRMNLFEPDLSNEIVVLHLVEAII